MNEIQKMLTRMSAIYTEAAAANAAGDTAKVAALQAELKAIQAAL